jgi:hypothetical protein
LFRRIALAGIGLSVGAGAVIYHGEIEVRVARVYWAHRCATHATPPGTVLFETDPVKAAHLIATNPDYIAYTDPLLPGSSGAAYSPVELRKYWKVAAANPIIYRPGFGPDQPVVFLGERTSPAGNRRLIVIADFETQLPLFGGISPADGLVQGDSIIFKPPSPIGSVAPRTFVLGFRAVTPPTPPPARYYMPDHVIAGPGTIVVKGNNTNLGSILASSGPGTLGLNGNNNNLGSVANPGTLTYSRAGAGLVNGGPLQRGVNSSAGTGGTTINLDGGVLAGSGTWTNTGATASGPVIISGSVNAGVADPLDPSHISIDFTIGAVNSTQHGTLDVYLRDDDTLEVKLRKPASP